MALESLIDDKNLRVPYKSNISNRSRDLAWILIVFRPKSSLRSSVRRLFTFCLSREKEFKPVQTSMQRSLGGHVRAKYAILRSNLSIQF